MIGKSFLPLGTQSFHIVHVILCWAEALIQCSPTCFSFVAFALGVRSKKSPRLIPAFFWFYGFRSQVQIVKPLNFCVLRKTVNQSHPFASGCPVFPIPFIEDCLFLIVQYWCLCHKLINHICIGLFLGYFVSLGHVSVFMPITPCFDLNFYSQVVRVMYFRCKSFIRYMTCIFSFCYCHLTLIVSSEARKVCNFDVLTYFILLLLLLVSYSRSLRFILSSSL